MSSTDDLPAELAKCIPEPKPVTGPYTIQRIESDTDGVNFRISDGQDDRIATSYNEEHARHVVRLMNLAETVIAAIAKATCDHSAYKGMDEHGRCCPTCGFHMVGYGD